MKTALKCFFWKYLFLPLLNELNVTSGNLIKEFLDVLSEDKMERLLQNKISCHVF